MLVSDLKERLSTKPTTSNEGPRPTARFSRLSNCVERGGARIPREAVECPINIDQNRSGGTGWRACMPRQGYTAQLHRAVSDKAGPCSLMKCRK